MLGPSWLMVMRRQLKTSSLAQGRLDVWHSIFTLVLVLNRVIRDPVGNPFKSLFGRVWEKPFSYVVFSLLNSKYIVFAAQTHDYSIIKKQPYHWYWVSPLLFSLPSVRNSIGSNLLISKSFYNSIPLQFQVLFKFNQKLNCHLQVTICYSITLNVSLSP